MFNPLIEGYVEDPFSHLAEVRQATPVQQILDRWGLFKYDDCFALLRDPAMSVDDAKSDIIGGPRDQMITEAAAAQGTTPTRDLSMLLSLIHI